CGSPGKCSFSTRNQRPRQWPLWAEENWMSRYYGPLPGHTVPPCVDMQNVFAEPTAWHTPWMARVLPAIEEIAGRHAEQTVFTRFIPPTRAQDVPGTREGYFRH